jgi:Ser/Thr protein kinase RdoA (MazF antagonist)
MEHVGQVVGAPVAVEELKRKPGRRRTFRATGNRRTAIVKIYESERAPVVAARVTALSAGPPEPRVPEVLHLDPGRRMVVLSEVCGTPLRESIVSGDVAACARAGRALAAWHRAWRDASPDGLFPHTMEDEERILLSWAESAPPPISAAVRSVLPSLRAEWRSTTVVHRDLYEEQVLLGRRVGLIDLDDAALGPPELDVGNLIAHVELLERRRVADFSAPRAALLGGYGADSLDAALFDRCRRLALLRLACIHGLPELVG